MCNCGSLRLQMEWHRLRTDHLHLHGGGLRQARLKPRTSVWRSTQLASEPVYLVGMNRSYSPAAAADATSCASTMG